MGCSCFLQTATLFVYFNKLFSDIEIFADFPDFFGGNGKNAIFHSTTAACEI